MNSPLLRRCFYDTYAGTVCLHVAVTFRLILLLLRLHVKGVNESTQLVYTNQSYKSAED